MEVFARSLVRWSSDNWATVHDQPTIDSGLGVHYVDLPASDGKRGDTVQFTFYWPDADRWEGINFQVQIDRTAADTAQRAASTEKKPSGRGSRQRAHR